MAQVFRVGIERCLTHYYNVVASSFEEAAQQALDAYGKAFQGDIGNYKVVLIEWSIGEQELIPSDFTNH